MSVVREYVLRNRSGLHARPAARFVELAKTFDSTVTVAGNGKTGNAKSLISMMKLGISSGSAVTLTADGSDEAEAIDALCTLLSEVAAEEPVADPT
jgi:phosphotransferase system HPr (HPr) family protein